MIRRIAAILLLVTFGLLLFSTVCNAEFISEIDDASKVSVSRSQWLTPKNADDGPSRAIVLFKMADSKAVNIMIAMYANRCYYFTNNMYIIFDDEEPIVVTYDKTKMFISNNLNSSYGRTILPLAMMDKIDKCQKLTLQIMFKNERQQTIELPNEILQEWKRVVNHHPE